MKPDFSGYATKANIKCSDGRTIRPGAFKTNNGQKVPLVWQHMRNDPENILGHAVLEDRPDGTYARCYFNDSQKAKSAREAVKHGDINSMSVYANRLVKENNDVMHGKIREVSLVISGANPGALIDNLALAHGDDFEVIEEEAIIHSGESFDEVEDPEREDLNHMAGESGKTVKDVLDSMTEEQKNVLYYILGEALDGEAEQSEEDGEDLEHDDNDEGVFMPRNVFETVFGGQEAKGQELSHDQLNEILADAKKNGSLKESFLEHATTYGIENIDLLFPDAKAITNSPEFVKRRTEWVDAVISGTHHSPFSRIKTLFADITADEARAKGYIKGKLKKEEFFALSKRTTGPQTFYKKQKLDRDDILDITDLDVVAWLKQEMRLMLDEELAGAVLFGDGRTAESEDKIKSPTGETGNGIRAIALDSEFYAPVVEVSDDEDFVDAVSLGLIEYEGTGSPTLYTSLSRITKLLLKKDTLGRRIYNTRADLASAMGVSRIVDIPDSVIARAPGVLGIIVNLKDYTLGADKGGQVSMFDDFDIDYNQYKYLIEGRTSGMLTRWKSAIVLKDRTPDFDEHEV